uniref:DUF4954 family protein n=1 Tax=Caenorhabditis tropicalis TaxID=1561998 RepID=A0A1I7T6N7_9PELO
MIQSVSFWMVMGAAAVPNPGNSYRSELIAAGLSSQAADGILKICKESSRNYQKSSDFKEAVTEVTRFYLKIENFIKTQSNEDQIAHGIYAEKKKEKYRN